MYVHLWMSFHSNMKILQRIFAACSLLKAPLCYINHLKRTRVLEAIDCHRLASAPQDFAGWKQTDPMSSPDEVWAIPVIAQIKRQAHLHLVGGLEHQFYFPISIGFLIIPILTNSYFSEGFKPPTRHMFDMHKKST